MNTVLLLAAIQAFFLAMLLFGKKKKQLSDLILGVWLGLIGLHLSINFVSASDHPYLLMLKNMNAGFPYLQGPFLFLYVLTLTKQTGKLRRVDYIHFGPFLLYITYQLIRLVGYMNSTQSGFITIYLFDQPELFNIVLLGSVPLYVIWSYLLLNTFRQRILNNYSTVDKINLNWLRYLIYGMGMVWLIVILVYISLKIGGVGENHDVRHLIFIAITIFVYAIGYFGLKQTTIFSDREHLDGELAQSETEEKQTDTISDEKKYKKPSLKEPEASKVLSQLQAYMESGKPHLNDQLTLPDVATQLKISVNHLSQIINELCQQNFFDFVNSYRVKEVKQKMLDPKNEIYSLLSIAHDCGFGSKSTFNRIFKNHTGQTPTQYKKTLRNI